MVVYVHVPCLSPLPGVDMLYQTLFTKPLPITTQQSFQFKLFRNTPLEVKTFTNLSLNPDLNLRYTSLYVGSRTWSTMAPSLSSGLALLLQ